MDLQKPLTFNISFEDWGPVEYSEGLDRQLSLLEKIASENSPGIIIFCQHPPVVTLGRATKTNDVTTWQGSTIEVSRGGRATYHGPNQLMTYAIVNLKYPRKNRGANEVVGFIRDFEQAIVNTLAEYGLQAKGKSLGDDKETTGVWIGEKKIASLGIAVKKWITYHGAAINLEEDPSAFQGLLPCGFQPSVMTSLEKTLGRKISREEFKLRLQRQLSLLL